MTTFLFLISTLDNPIPIWETDTIFSNEDDAKKSFITNFPILHEMILLMNCTKMSTQNDSFLFEPIIEGQQTISVTINDHCFYLPFYNYMSYYHVRHFFALFFPYECTFYYKNKEEYYQPKHDHIYIPRHIKQMIITEEEDSILVILNSG